VDVTRDAKQRTSTISTFLQFPDIRGFKRAVASVAKDATRSRLHRAARVPRRMLLHVYS